MMNRNGRVDYETVKYGEGFTAGRFRLSAPFAGASDGRISAAVRQMAILLTASLFPWISNAFSAETTVGGGLKAGAGMRDITMKKRVSAVPLEASGLVYVPEFKSYLVVSDDTEKKAPVLFVMDASGAVEAGVVIGGLKKINDVESIAAYGQSYLYVLSSQSFNREGKQPHARRLFVRLRKNGTELVLDKSVALFDLLLSAAGDAKGAAWAEFVRRGSLERSIDIEGMAFLNDTLLLGFKNPKIGDDAVILAVAAFDDALELNRLSGRQVSLWRAITLRDSSTHTACGISDLTSDNGLLYGVSTGVASRGGTDADIGLYWIYSPETGDLRILRRFPGLKPEGIAFDETGTDVVIVFDNGTGNPSQFMTLEAGR